MLSSVPLDQPTSHFFSDTNNSEEELRSEDEPTLENSLNVKKAENEIYPDTMKARRQATMHHQPMVQHANSKTRTNLHQEANRRGEC